MMSMPNFPVISPEITRESAVNMILASIAMEELALSHIMNAEGEKIQYILGTLPNKTEGHCVTIKDILEVNKSVGSVLEKVMENQIILKNKLETVVNFEQSFCGNNAEKCCDEKSNAVFCYDSLKNFIWNEGCYLSLICSSIKGDAIEWSAMEPNQIYLLPKKQYMMSFVINIDSCECHNNKVSIAIQSIICGKIKNLYIYHQPYCSCGHQEFTISCSGIIISTEKNKHQFSIVLNLLNPEAVSVKRVNISVIEL